MAHHTRAAPSHSGHPHALSLKVLRLSRPTLATQSPLPPTNFGDGLDIPTSASLAFPKTADDGRGEDGGFPLTPLLTLPAAFGAAYVGEGFGCTLCVNCEGTRDGEGGLGSGDGKKVGGVRIQAELQMPGKEEGVRLALKRGDGNREDEDEDVDESGDGDEDENEDTGIDVSPGETLQYTLSHDLKEEGPHVLAVTVSYTETLHASHGASGGRARTFRKLYQFVAQPLIAVRSKVTELKRRAPEEEGRRWVLEAQLENVGESAVVLETVRLKEREGIKGKGVHDDDDEEQGRENTVLKPQDVEQVMFLLREEGNGQEEAAGERLGRRPLAQVHIRWRSAMGEEGTLTTGWLASRPR